MGRLLAPERLARLRQKQEVAFTPVFLHRPMAILLLIPTADIGWITPNRLTTANILLRLIAAALVWPQALGGLADSTLSLWGAVVLWHLGGALDAADGALARYRGHGSYFGRFYDKVSDRLVTLTLVLSLSARAYVSTPPDAAWPGVVYVLLALVYVACMSACSVAKWVELSLHSEIGGGGKAQDPGEVAAPERGAGEWVLFLGKRLKHVFVVTEMDLPLWGSIALIGGWESWLFIYLGFYALPYSLGAIGVRGRRIRALDRPPVTG